MMECRGIGYCSAAELKGILEKMNLDTGDVVLFDRKCNSMGLYGGMICHSAKLFGQTRWDHNGVIVKTDDGLNNLASCIGKLMFLEAAMNGVKLRPLIDRILYSRSYEIFHTKTEFKVVCIPTDSMNSHRSNHHDMQSFSTLAHHLFRLAWPANSSTTTSYACAFPYRLTDWFLNLKVELKRQIKTIQDDITHRSKMTPFEKNSLRAELASLREQHDAIVQQLDQTERSVLCSRLCSCQLSFSQESMTRSVFENKAASSSDPARFFCSQLVAALYQHVGLLLPYPAATSYRPHNFSETDDYIKLQSSFATFEMPPHTNFCGFVEDAAWLPQISLREHFTDTEKQLDDEAIALTTPPPPDVLDKIVYTLQRHAVFHAYTESELRDVARQFRRKRYRSTHAKDLSSAPGDYFYVITDGTVDVLVNYDAYAREQPKDSVAVEVTTGGALPTLRRNMSKSFDNQDLAASSHFVHVATNGPGNAFGDSALMYNTPRRATIKCSEPVLAYALDKATFADVVKRHPAATQSLAERQFLMQTLANHPLFANVSDQAQAAADRSILLSTTRSGSTALLDIFNKTASLHDGDESFLTSDDVANLLEGDAGVNTVQTLLFPDKMTKINFSQFAHFHMCVEAYSSRQFNPLLAEAFYRVHWHLFSGIRN
ncbi:hypothetical protein DYB32_005981 [Aphanomyces invadans]|uniref:Cyclic nucleotide-binding domain-containing protein n=1 Tax=Aphanomyces invadans TaxID=157072 RepID=A0A3R7A7G0_9STRA|nr:hypothetical protein DYB32_005981 [Aphanomyces invadans]